MSQAKDTVSGAYRLTEMSPFAELVIQCATVAFNDHARATSTTVEHAPNMLQTLPRTSQVVYLLLAADSLHVTLKFFYEIDVAKNLVATRLNRKIKDVSNELTADFMRELCNLTAGYIHRKLQAALLLWISLPYIRPGSDDPLYKNRETAKPAGTWIIKTPSGNLHCIAEVVILEPAAIKAIDFKALAKVEDEQVSML